MMRFILLLTTLFMCLYLPAQEAFTQNRWITNGIIGLKDFKFSSTAEDIMLDTLNRKYPYGYITEFLPDNQFISYNIGPCGNECRIMTKGSYAIAKNTIELFVISVNYAKDCKATPSEEVNTSLGLYQWEQQGTRLILKPVKQ